MGISAYQYYPSGARRILGEDEKKGDIEVDFEITELNHKLNLMRREYHSFEFRDSVIECVKRLFGDFGDWLDAQEDNAKLSEHAYEFIKETIEFINTGKRPVLIITRASILRQEMKGGFQDDVKVATRKTRLRDMLHVDPKNFVFAWSQHRGGFEDMLCTSVFLFGTDFRE